MNETNVIGRDPVQRQLPLREEIRALVEDEVMPLIEPTIAVMQQGPLPFTTDQELDEPAPYRVPGQPTPLSWILAADREAGSSTRSRICDFSLTEYPVHNEGPAG